MMKEFNEIFPDYPGVGSLCIKCDFCTYSDECNTMEEGHIDENGNWICSDVLLHGSYICSNPKSEMFESCVVGHLGCKEASQMKNLSDIEKEGGLAISRTIASRF